MITVGLKRKSSSTQKRTCTGGNLVQRLDFHATSGWVPRRNTAVKGEKTQFLLTTPGWIDLHFHGAFGIDVMTAAPQDLDLLAERLAENGIAAFCPTTLSVPAKKLEAAVTRLGVWIEETRKPRRASAKARAFPIGIHLEGPFLSPQACGAHPPGSIRPATLSELNRLWKASRGFLKILTLAPETLSSPELRRVSRWCRTRGIVLSLGHSRATEEQAAQAFELGFSGVTHAWNALTFHHRAPGPLGAALGRKDIYLELILDQVHVSPTVIRWTRQLHGSEPICFVSDCVPATGTHRLLKAGPGPWTSFGPLRIRYENGACRLKGGHLAGGGILPPEAYRRWAEQEAKSTGEPLARILKRTCRHFSSDPVRALGLTPAEQKQASLLQIHWRVKSGRLTFDV